MDKQLTANSVCFSYAATQVLHNISFSVPQGVLLSLVGANASGKSTLFRLLCGARACASGEVTWDGRNVFSMRPQERARLFSVVHQREENNLSFTCLESVLMGLYPDSPRFGEPTAAQLEAVRDTMQATDTLHLAAHAVTQISGGEFQRVALARALVQKPQVLFLDEATSGMDVAVKIRLMKHLRTLIASSGMTVIMVNHDLSAAYQYSDLIAALHQGRLAAFGTPEQVMDTAFFASVFGVQAEILSGKGFFIHDAISPNLTHSTIYNKESL